MGGEALLLSMLSLCGLFSGGVRVWWGARRAAGIPAPGTVGASPFTVRLICTCGARDTYRSSLEDFDRFLADSPYSILCSCLCSMKRSNESSCCWL